MISIYIFYIFNIRLSILLKQGEGSEKIITLEKFYFIKMNVYNKMSPAYKHTHAQRWQQKTFFDSHQLPIGSCKNIVKTQYQLYSFGLEFRPRYIILAHTMYTTISNICKETFYDSQEREFKTYCKKQECGQSRVVWY